MPHSIPDISSLEIEAHAINRRVDIVTMGGNMTPQRVADILIAHENNPDIGDLLDILFAGYESDEAEELTLPEVAPELYKNRLNKKENPLEFLKRVWGKYLDAGILFQDNLKGKNGMDGALIDAIRAYCTHHDLVASDYLPPPKSTRISTELLEDIPLDKISARQYFTKAKRARRNG